MRRALLLVVAVVACRRAPRNAPHATAAVPLEAVDAGPREVLETPPPEGPPRMFRMDPRHTGRSGWRLPRNPVIRARFATHGRITSQAVVSARGDVVVTSHDGSIYALDADGALRWQLNTGDRIYTTPVARTDGTLVFGSDADRVVIVGGDGALRLALGLDGSVVVGTFGPRARVVSLDRATGALRWERSVDGPPTRDYGVASSALVDADGDYAVGVPDDALWILHRDGSMRARVALPADVDGSPALVADRVLVVGCDDGVVYFVGDGARDE